MKQALAEFHRTWKSGDHEGARVQARAYVARHRAELEPILAPLTLVELVDLVVAYRNAGREEDRIVTDMWLLSEYAPQNITGSLIIGPDQMAKAIGG